MSAADSSKLCHSQTDGGWLTVADR